MGLFGCVQNHRTAKGYIHLSLSLALGTLVLTSGCGDSRRADVADPGLDGSKSAIENIETNSRSAANASANADPTATVTNPPFEPPTASSGNPSTKRAAPPEQLEIGDPSPGLAVAKWVKGDPVTEPLTKQVHVVEFWATWCGPCRVGMPHITELQKEYADEVTFIGVTREDEATVEKFLASDSPQGTTWDDVIGYRLAIDQDAWTNTAYMRAAGQNGIPCAFIVGRDGAIEWIGHPASIDEPLKKIVEGSWDRDAAIAEYKKDKQFKNMMTEINQLVRSRDWDGALERLDRFEGEFGKSTSVLFFRLRLLETAGRAEQAAAVRNELVEAAWDEPNVLNQVAWAAATSADAPDLELALKAARRASELRDDKDGAVLDTLARCYYEMGELEEAIRWQRLAVQHAQGQRQIANTLQEYLDEQTESDKAASESTGIDASETTPGEAPEAEVKTPESETPESEPAAEQDPETEPTQ